MAPITEDIFIAEINKNQGIIHKICLVYFRDPAARQDASQEILYQLWKSYPSFKNESKFSTWMYRVALNTAITFFKKATKELGKDSLPENYAAIADNNDQSKLNENIVSLYAAINTLSEIDKAIILLYLEDNSYEEIASITGLTKTNVSVRLVRIKRGLKEKMKSINQ